MTTTKAGVRQAWSVSPRRSGLRVVSAIKPMRCSLECKCRRSLPTSPSLSSEADPRSSNLSDLPDFVELMFLLMLASVSER